MLEDAISVSDNVARRAAPVELRRRRTAEWLDTLIVLTYSDLRVRYGRGPWQVFKWLLDPFALVGVYLLLLVFVLDRGGEAPALSLTCAALPFQLLTATLVNATTAVKIRESIVLNMAFGRVLMPISSAVTETIAFGAAFILLPIAMLVDGVAPNLAAAWLPVVVVVNVFFAIACAYPASLIGVWFPDLRNHVVNVVRMLFFLGPGLVPLSEVSGTTRTVLLLNPLTGLFESFRDVLLYGRAPDGWYLAYPIVLGLVLLALFVPVYRREQWQFAKLAE